METLFLWVRLLLFCFKRGGDLVLVGKAPFILFQRGGDLVLVGKAPFILFQKRWRLVLVGKAPFICFKEVETLFLWVRLL